MFTPPPNGIHLKKSTRFTLGAKLFIIIVVALCIASAYTIASVLMVDL